MGKLNGMFAFALHDRRDGSLILGRDRLGIKPLFYAVEPDCVLFASEIKALLVMLSRTPAINESALLQYFENDFNSGTDTIFEGIHRVPAGSCLKIDSELRIRTQAYWQLTTVSPQTLTQSDAEAEFSALMKQVLLEHVRSDVPFGLFLSGGVDSAIICALLAQQRAPLRTYSVGYSNTAARNELDAADRIARTFGTDHNVLMLDPASLFRRLPHVIYATDELMQDNATLPTSFLAERAGSDLKVVFTGEGGDEVFAGYGRYRKHPLQRFLANLASPGSGGFRTRGLWPRRRSARIFGRELRAVDGARRRPFIEAWQRAPSDWSALQKGQYVDIETALQDNLLVKVDRALMSFALEGRVPYLDHRVVEFGLGLPDALKVNGRTGKYFLRQWATRLLPAEHLFATKRGFHVPIDSFFTQETLLKLEQALPANQGIATWLNPEAVRELVREHAAGKHATNQLWSLVQFAIWYQLFVAHPEYSPSPDENPLDLIA